MSGGDEYCEIDTPALRRILRRLSDYNTAAPCDNCRLYPCGSVCAAFVCYVEGRPWQTVRRAPSERLLNALLRE